MQPALFINPIFCSRNQSFRLKIIAWTRSSKKYLSFFSAPPCQLGGRPVRLKCNWALQIFSIAPWTKHYCNDFFWIAIKFLRTAHVKAGRLISHHWINNIIPNSDTHPVYPPGIHVTIGVTRVSRVGVTREWGKPDVILRCKWRNVHILYTFSVHCVNIWGGECTCTIDNIALREMILSISFSLSGSEVSGHYDNLEPRLERSHQRERVITGVMS